MASSSVLGDSTTAAIPMVTWEDQHRINTFGRLSVRVQEMEMDIQEKKQQLEQLEDVSSELFLLDDDHDEVAKDMNETGEESSESKPPVHGKGIPMRIGEVFVFLNKSEVEGRIQNMEEQLRKEMYALQSKMDEIQCTLQELKTILYGKFHEAIQLEWE